MTMVPASKASDMDPTLSIPGSFYCLEERLDKAGAR